MSTLIVQRNKQPERLSESLVVTQQIGVELAFEPQAPPSPAEAEGHALLPP